ncbi:hypothetical protein H9P43_003060 [Blastocladiella emersonii ATCC 22665]|nr:hypothetical protein H9P43_003060 [Blastocladiella emersonii ATCC 22665]
MNPFGPCNTAPNSDDDDDNVPLGLHPGAAGDAPAPAPAPALGAPPPLAPLPLPLQPVSDGLTTTLGDDEPAAHSRATSAGAGDSLFGDLDAEDEVRGATAAAMDATAATVATSLFHGRVDGTPVATVSGIASWLGRARDPVAALALRHYFDHFDFVHETLLAALRRVAAHLFLQAEAQQLDRILEAFAARFAACQTAPLISRATAMRRRMSVSLPASPVAHQFDVSDPPSSASVAVVMSEGAAATAGPPGRLNRNKDVLQASAPMLSHPSPISAASPASAVAAPASYALDEGFSGPEQRLWCSFGEKAPGRYARAQGIAHTISFSLLLLNTDLHTTLPAGVKQERMTKKQFVTNTLAALATYHLSAADRAQLDELLRGYYSDLKRRELRQPLFVQLRSNTSGSTPPVPPLPSPARTEPLSSAAPASASSYGSRAPPRAGSSGASVYSVSSWRRRRTESGMWDSSTTDVTSATTPRASTDSAQTVALPADGIRQATMFRKHLLSSSGARPANRSWKLCTVQLTVHGLVMHAGRTAGGTSTIANVHCQAAAFTGVPHLQYATSRPHVWSLATPDGALCLFQAPSAQDRADWVHLVNAWNARWSRGPTTFDQEGLGSARYGWEDDAAGRALVAWHPPPAIPYPSTEPEPEQLGHCNAQLRRHEALLAAHIERAAVLPPPASVTGKDAKRRAELAHANWRRRLEHLNREVGKWRLYTDALSTAPLLTPRAPSPSVGPSPGPSGSLNEGGGSSREPSPERPRITGSPVQLPAELPAQIPPRGDHRAWTSPLVGPAPPAEDMIFPLRPVSTGYYASGTAPLAPSPVATSRSLPASMPYPHPQAPSPIPTPTTIQRTLPPAGFGAMVARPPRTESLVGFGANVRMLEEGSVLRDTGTELGSVLGDPGRDPVAALEQVLAPTPPSPGPRIIIPPVPPLPSLPSLHALYSAAAVLSPTSAGTQEGGSEAGPRTGDSRLTFEEEVWLSFSQVNLGGGGGSGR